MELWTSSRFLAAISAISFNAATSACNGIGGIAATSARTAGRIGANQLRWMRALLESEARGDVHPRAEIVLR